MEEYIVSARKYRPMTFDSVVGQSALTTTLKNAVKSGKLAHAYLFCGPRGVGKTTCARIFAKAINCEHPKEDGEACNECESCKSFNEQRSYNIFELDAASNNGVDHIKELMEKTRIPPQIGKYKVFIIDEVHMLSSAAFNAFLKTLEEPPQHVIFILATTEKHKILPTILSRCQIYDFERMTVPNTINHLKMVAEKEGISYEEQALAVIAEKADGGMRDALSIFDQAVSFCQGNLTYQKVTEDLNVLDSDNYFKLIDCALENNVSEMMLLLNGILDKGFDGGNMIQGLAQHVRNVLMAKDAKTLPLLETSEAQKAKYQQQAQKAPTPFLYKALQIANKCDINYRQSSNKRLLVELTLIEIGQITQPEDKDIPSAGRTPNRLKSLFQKIIAQLKPAIQGAGAELKGNGEENNEKTPQTAVQPLHASENEANNEAADNKHQVKPISKGAVNGVKENDAVLYGRYLICIVKKAYPTYSIVTTVLDPDFSVSAYDINSGEVSYVTGDAKLAADGCCKFENLSTSTDITYGSIIASAGISSKLPKGLIIGTVEEVADETTNISTYAIVKPGTDIANITDCLVLTGFTPAKGGK